MATHIMYGEQDLGRRRRRHHDGEIYENLVQAGVIDPTKVVRSALQNAASVASLLLTTEAVAALTPDDRYGGS